jgi:hypothetical protein
MKPNSKLLLNEQLKTMVEEICTKVVQTLPNSVSPSVWQGKQNRGKRRKNECNAKTGENQWRMV